LQYQNHEVVVIVEMYKKNRYIYLFESCRHINIDSDNIYASFRSKPKINISDFNLGLLNRSFGVYDLSRKYYRVIMHVNLMN
jgi:hypothetical protein